MLVKEQAQRLLVATAWSHARLLAFHAPFYLFTGMCGLVYQLIPTAYGRAMTVTADAIALGIYTILVWNVEGMRSAAAPPAPPAPQDAP